MRLYTALIESRTRTVLERCPAAVGTFTASRQVRGTFVVVRRRSDDAPRAGECPDASVRQGGAGRDVVGPAPFASRHN